MRRISGVRELRAGVEVVLGVQPDADAVARYGRSGPCAGWRWPGEIALDGQALDLGAVAVAGDAGGARVDDVLDARDGQRGLGDVRGQHDPAAGVRLEDAVLLGVREPRVQREDLGEAVAASC